MKMFHFKAGPIAANSYILYNDAGRGFIIDPGGSYKRVSLEAQKLGVTLEAVLLTHGHFDHALAAAELQAHGAKVYIHENDAEKLSGNGNLGYRFGCPFQTLVPDYLLHDGESLSLCGMTVRVIHTPGHTSGGVCFLIDNALFTGDTLFHNSIGRTDLGDGSISELVRSVNQKLFTLPGDYTVYPGHEDFTTLEEERRENPYLEFGWNHEEK